MPSQNQLEQMAAARALSMKNNSCYPNDSRSMPDTSKEPGSQVDAKVTEGEMYGR